MLDFPSSGLVAGVTTVTGPSGQVWKWDGKKWVAVGAGGPQMGVTDGSDAAAGEIGECITNSSGFTNMISTTGPGGVLVLTSINLTAGDWDVWAKVMIGRLASAAATQLQFFITTYTGSNISMNEVPYAAIKSTPGLEYNNSIFEMRRFNTSVPIVLNLAVVLSGTVDDTVPFNINRSWLQARRMR